MNITEQYPESSNGIVQLVKFGLDGEPNDFRMYVSRLVRKYRVSDAPFPKELESLLHSATAFKPAPIRNANREVHLTGKPPVLSVGQRPDAEKKEPLLPEWIAKQIEEMFEDRRIFA
ncbi:hypothetical protein WM015_08630 [Bifidobacterium mongoliense]|uniref:hypothetical protein n=1 Tax=Bifidobacterium mongoliense TaxID=518643 RepID=UPI0030F3B87C